MKNIFVFATAVATALCMISCSSGQSQSEISTIDTAMQAMCHDVLQYSMWFNNSDEGQIIVMDKKTGGIRAMSDIVLDSATCEFVGRCIPVDKRNMSGNGEDSVCVSEFSGCFPTDSPKYSVIVSLRNRESISNSHCAIVFRRVTEELAMAFAEDGTRTFEYADSVIRQSIVNKDSLLFSYQVSYPIAFDYPLGWIWTPLQMQQKFKYIFDDEIIRMVKNKDVKWSRNEYGYTLGGFPLLRMSAKSHLITSICKIPVDLQFECLDRRREEQQMMNSKLEADKWTPVDCFRDKVTGNVYHISKSENDDKGYRMLEYKKNSNPGDMPIAIYNGFDESKELSLRHTYSFYDNSKNIDIVDDWYTRQYYIKITRGHVNESHLLEHITLHMINYAKEEQ